MKKLLFALVFLMMAYACNDKVCKINGTISDPVDTVRLVNMDGDLLDVAAVNNGAFALKCDINPNTGVSILRGEEYDPIALIPDSKKITVSMADGLPVVTGSPLSQDLQALSQWAMTTFFEHTEKAMALLEAGDTLGTQAVQEEMHQVMATHCREVYMQHQSDPVGLQAMLLLMNFVERQMSICFLVLSVLSRKTLWNSVCWKKCRNWILPVPKLLYPFVSLNKS